MAPSLACWPSGRNAIVEELSASTGATGLDLLSNVIKEIEREPFEGPALTALAQRLKGDDGVRSAAASRGIARLARISDWADSRHNVFVRLSEMPLLFTLQIGICVRIVAPSPRRGSCATGLMRSVRWKRCCRSRDIRTNTPPIRLPRSSSADEPLFDATEMAHPLIPAAIVIVAAGQHLRASRPQVPSPQVLIVSGSNMSGKSTLMRTTGINAVLALAGAPVRAAAHCG